MAEFQNVMRQWQRMCTSMQEKNMSCKENCLLGNNPTCGELEYATLEEINNTETVIMKWAAEHPEPVYPTWANYLETLGLYNENVGVMVDNLENTRISPEMAQRLGIEPKEG